MRSWVLLFLLLVMGGAGYYFYRYHWLPTQAYIHELEKEHEALLKKLGNPKPSVPSPPSTLQDSLVLLVDEIFRPGTPDLSEKGRKQLQRIAKEIRSLSPAQIEVEAHADSTPVGKQQRTRFPTNWELSAYRATAVTRFLIAQGLPAHLFKAVSRADTRPVAPNNTPEGRRQNRRVVIKIYKKST